MTAEQIAAVFHARRIGDARWVAKCPAHPDRSPSLSIGTGRDGRVLLNCFAGCAVTAILSVVGLKLRDLFPGPPPSQAEARRSAVLKQRLEQERRDNRLKRIAVSEQARQWNQAVNVIGARLAVTSDDAGDGERLTRLFHESLDKLRAAELKVS
jgi:hypothetical protein